MINIQLRENIVRNIEIPFWQSWNFLKRFKKNLFLFFKIVLQADYSIIIILYIYSIIEAIAE